VQPTNKNASKRKTSTTNGSDGMRASFVAAMVFASSSVGPLAAPPVASATSVNPVSASGV
jgi:hypothetical protein